jgi:predicted nucleotidyltransferase
MSKVNNDQKEVDIFIDDLVEKISSKYSKEIDFIILFGSAARGEFVKGSSDIDMVIQLLDKTKKKEISDYSEEVFWKLDKKYSMGFSKYLANSKGKDIFDDIFRSLENSFNLYTPIFVFGPDEIDWTKGTALNINNALLASLIVSYGTVFYKFKKEGKIIFGRDIRNEISVDFSLWERWKGVCIPTYLIVFSLIICLFFPNRALKYAVKALLWDIDSSLIYLKKIIEGRNNQLKELRNQGTFVVDVNQISEYLKLKIRLKYCYLTTKDLNIVGRSLQYKHNNFQSKYFESIIFVWKTFILILKINFLAITKSF